MEQRARAADRDSLDLVERIIQLGRDQGIELDDEDFERLNQGEWPDDWPNDAAIPRRPNLPTLPVGAEASAPADEYDRESE